jgi:hypothetical protein
MLSGTTFTGLPSDMLINYRAFEQVYGYVDYTESDPYNPIKSATHHQTRRKDRCLEERINFLLDLGVPDRSNMGLDDLLDLPPDILEMVIENTRNSNRKAAKDAELAEENLSEKLDNISNNKK